MPNTVAQKKSLGKVASTQKQAQPQAPVTSSKSLKDLYHNDVNIKYPEPKPAKDRPVKGSKSKGLQSSSSTHGLSTSKMNLHQDDHHDSDSQDESPRPESFQTYSSPPSHTPEPPPAAHPPTASPPAPVQGVRALPYTRNQILLALAYVVLALLACFIIVTFIKCLRLQSSMDAHPKKRGR